MYGMQLVESAVRATKWGLSSCSVGVGVGVEGEHGRILGPGAGNLVAEDITI